MGRMDTVTEQPCVLDGLVSVMRKCEVRRKEEKKRKDAWGGGSVVEVVDAWKAICGEEREKKLGGSRE